MKNAKPKILVFIPAYRCEVQITRVLDQFDQNTQALFDTVMVLDNRSPDDTLQIAAAHGARKFTECKFMACLNRDNYGLGGSHKVAFRYGLEHDFDYLVVLHGDDQADIRDLTPILSAGFPSDVDCLLGSRFMRGSKLKGYSRFRTFGNIAYNLLFSMATRRGIKDLGSGLNLYKLATFQDFYYKNFPDDLTFNYVMLLASYHRHQNVKYFPISWREEDQRSNVKLFQQAFRVLGLLGRYVLGGGRFLSQEMRSRPHELYASNAERADKLSQITGP
ncbi:glycosyltransferase family 2 protein [Achromobacter xylosoxidans]|jgi:glycosyltransferase involved in cell wall biosynthesis|uniref:glycosyltransferase family 2 protein n=1 Tax=Alcaligenes xylosoxydans xylosoxydans TaxID=85698 RepID=UPI0006C5E666|nr:glycosyltransferase family 2 protein [Achromobacter xylosoxidans]QQE55275.1 glycosyltransferase family 2 protein [Achromobacter xylosoxidans]QQV14919.1 glycosyltransferase family 2 protein [Achromobacter xylosoxidans]UXL04977.1 glycosyltransferase family 2 protein [Achromobacter xylosoxidans]CUI80504.1 putative glucosyl-3-phosphoglycerate synthase [Achromobacter xylosoxidans]